MFSQAIIKDLNSMMHSTYHCLIEEVWDLYDVHSIEYEFFNNFQLHNM